MKSIISEALEWHGEEKKNAELLEGKLQPVSANPDDKELQEIIDTLQVSIKIFGCGGGGCNTVNRCMREGISGAQMAAANTDAKHLLSVQANRKFLIGKNRTRGLGAGAIPQVGEEATRENEGEIRNYLAGSNIVFITAGMGGGTGTGSAPTVAKLAKEAGALVMGVVTLPFKAEGTVRMQNAEWGLDRLARVADTVITIPNDKLLELVPKLPLDQAFKVADEILMNTIKGITEIITKPGLVNLDYSDIQTIMKGGGVAMVGLGESDGTTERVTDAIGHALSCPLLGDMDITKAKGALIRVVGGPDMTVTDAQKAAELVSSKLSPSARIIWGCSIEADLARRIKVLLILTGVKGKYLISKEDGSAVCHTSVDGIDEVR